MNWIFSCWVVHIKCWRITNFFTEDRFTSGRYLFECRKRVPLRKEKASLAIEKTSERQRAANFDSDFETEAKGQKETLWLQLTAGCCPRWAEEDVTWPSSPVATIIAPIAGFHRDPVLRDRAAISCHHAIFSLFMHPVYDGILDQDSIVIQGIRVSSDHHAILSLSLYRMQVACLLEKCIWY